MFRVYQKSSDGAMKRIQFLVTYPERFVHPFHHRIMENPSISRAELLMWSPTEDATTLFWCDGDRDATEAVLGDIDSLVASTFVEDQEGTYAFLQQADYQFADALLEVIGRSHVIFLPPVTFLETGAVQFEAVGETTAIGEFHGKLSELGDLSIERVREFEREHSPSDLTDRQEEALETAVAVGYYEIPREGTVSDVADALGCSTSTAGELVRKAEASVVRGYSQTG